jgi:hypothetical protein
MRRRPPGRAEARPDPAACLGDIRVRGAAGRRAGRLPARYKQGIPGANFAFRYSYGDPQPVQVLAKRALGAVTVKYKINGGATQSAPTSDWTGGERYKPASVYYRVMRGTVTGTEPGHSVEVWFEGGGQKNESFTYQMVSDTNNRMLVVAAEDCSGASPVQTPGPHYAHTYLDALAANRDHPVPDQRHRQPVRRARPVVADGTTSTRRSPTCRTSGSRARSRCPRVAAT